VRLTQQEVSMTNLLPYYQQVYMMEQSLYMMLEVNIINQFNNLQQENVNIQIRYGKLNGTTFSYELSDLGSESILTSLTKNKYLVMIQILKLFIFKVKELFW
jgi:hypothetical protein